MHMHAAAVAKKIIFVCNLALTCERNFLITETLFLKNKIPSFLQHVYKNQTSYTVKAIMYSVSLYKK